MSTSLIDRVIARHAARFGALPDAAAYAPGRVEILGNHTDYNEGYVLSAAIDSGICVCASKGAQKQCVLAALDIGEELKFDLPAGKPVQKPLWANYIIGTTSKLGGFGPIKHGFNLTFAGDVPQGAGLSSSAALEVAVALALGELFNLTQKNFNVGRAGQPVPPFCSVGQGPTPPKQSPWLRRLDCPTLPKAKIASLSSSNLMSRNFKKVGTAPRLGVALGEAWVRAVRISNSWMPRAYSAGAKLRAAKAGRGIPTLNDRMQIARLCQQAENEFTGARCGLLDQISSLFGAEHALVFTDFRTLAVETLPIASDVCFLLANTRVKHNLVESAYNERRAACERAAEYFAGVLNHPVKALRDVTLEELEKYSQGLDPVIFRRARHICGENERVLEARELLAAGKMKKFGKLMFASHESSRVNFENSCPELDFVVDTAARLPRVLGARLSGGGFGGSVVMLIKPEDAAEAGRKISEAYTRRFGAACEVRVVKPSAGARVLRKAEG